MANYSGVDAGFYVPKQPSDRTLYETIGKALTAPENLYKKFTRELWSWDDGFDDSIDEEPQYKEDVETTRYIGQKIMIQEGEKGEPQEYWFRDGGNAECQSFIFDGWHSKK